MSSTVEANQHRCNDHTQCLCSQQRSFHLFMHNSISNLSNDRFRHYTASQTIHSTIFCQLLALSSSECENVCQTNRSTVVSMTVHRTVAVSASQRYDHRLCVQCQKHLANMLFFL